MLYLRANSLFAYLKYEEFTNLVSRQAWAGFVRIETAFKFTGNDSNENRATVRTEAFCVH